MDQTVTIKVKLLIKDVPEFDPLKFTSIHMIIISYNYVNI